jgi:CCR4-NOT transcription complex subunit 1
LECGSTDDFIYKPPLFTLQVLGIAAGVLLQDHEVHLNDFQQLPYHRIFIILFLELNTPEPVLEVINFQVLTAFCHTLHILRPTHAPGFAYAWLELVSHRVFIGRMLAITPQQKVSFSSYQRSVSINNQSLQLINNVLKIFH